jgi:hypothetical protein
MTDQLRVGFRRLGRGALAAWLLAVFLASGLAGSCAEDNFPTEREQPGGPTGPSSLIDAGGDAEESICPAEVPKIGQNCPAGSMENLSRCTFVIGACMSQGSTYDITVDYCCAQGGVWENCGTNTTPCDREEPDAAVSPPGDGGA